MQFISVNYSLNQTYQVEKTAFRDAVKNTFNEDKNFKLINSKIVINEGKKLLLELEVEILKNIQLEIMLTKVTTKLNENISNLIDTKPKNIKIIIKNVVNK